MLLRVVAVSGRAVTGVVPDPARRRPGRGAHLHPDPACLALAERRRAFGRALRVTGVLDTGPLTAYLTTESRTTEAIRNDRKQDDRHEHTMNPQK
jgi:predicted RNA-binding protein YlxR (DUF448 family)